MDVRTRSLLSGLVIGVLVGAILMQFVTPPISGTSVPSHGLTTATGCAEPSDPRASIGHVPNSDYRAVYLMNYSFVHENPDIEVRAELTDSASNAWIFAITTSTAGDGRDLPEDCQPRTILDASIALPTTAETLTITLDGDRIVIVETRANEPRFRYLDG